MNNLKKFLKILNLKHKEVKSWNDIKRSYRTLAKEYHPDANKTLKDDNTLMIELNNAYSWFEMNWKRLKPHFTNQDVEEPFSFEKPEINPQDTWIGEETEEWYANRYRTRVWDWEGDLNCEQAVPAYWSKYNTLKNRRVRGNRAQYQSMKVMGVFVKRVCNRCQILKNYTHPSHSDSKWCWRMHKGGILFSNKGFVGKAQAFMYGGLSWNGAPIKDKWLWSGKLLEHNRTNK